MPKILHILDRLNGAGPTRALLSLVKHQKALNLPYTHDLVILSNEIYPYTKIMAKRLGMEQYNRPDKETIANLTAKADIVQIHFYNSPAFYDFMRTSWPDQRRLLWLTNTGTEPPQCLPTPLIQSLDCLIATSPMTLDLGQFKDLESSIELGYIPPAIDFDRLEGPSPAKKDQFLIGYIGTVGFSKLHPEFAQMCAGITIPNSHFVLCGGPNALLKQQLEALNILDRFTFKGFVENIGRELAAFDVFGYPLSPDVTATGELALQEAMAAGVPPVVFPYGGIKFIVENGRTGLVVQTPQEYSEAIISLYHNPQQRKRLGENASEYIRSNLDPVKVAKDFDDQYQRLLAQPKRPHPWQGVTNQARPAARYAEAMSPCAPCFSKSLESPDPAAENQIINATILLTSSEGGLFQYRNTYPEDAFIRFWSGLALLGQQRSKEAEVELQAALELGIDPAYTAPYL